MDSVLVWLTITAPIIFLIYAVFVSGKRSRSAEGEPVGFGGWITLFSLVIIFTPLALLAQFVRLLPYHSLNSLDGLFAVTVQLFLIGFSFFVLSLFFNKKKKFPTYYTRFTISYLVLNLINIWVSSSSLELPNELIYREYGQIIGGFLSFLVWVFYVWRSRRVALTFINP